MTYTVSYLCHTCKSNSMNIHQFEAIINAIKDPAIVISRDYQIVAANQSYRDRYNPKPKGHSCFRISHGYKVPCDQAGEDCPLKKSLESKQRERILHIHNTSLGKEHVDVELTPVTNEESGEVDYFVEVMKTIEPAAHKGKAMLGFSPAFNRMLEQLNRAAPSNINVLLLGESGTGKELAAQYLHNNSPRNSKPFVTLECAGLSETLFESELFGHVKGAFTGASTNKPGLVESANGGTLFLDELADIPLAMQVKLLRLIETGTYRSVGSVEEKTSDFRLICATHGNLELMVKEGLFRKDLFYRISTFPVYLPSLNERREDIILIANSLLKELATERNLELSKQAENWLTKHNYDGNIRELRNLMERAILLCDGKQIDTRHLSSNTLKEPEDFKLKSLTQVENEYIQQALKEFHGNQKELAESLGISERTLYRKLNKQS